MYRIRRFGIVKTATMAAVLYMVVVAIFVIPFFLLLAATASSIPTGGRDLGIDFSGAFLVGGLALILGYGLIGWVFTAITCALYNLVAGWIGGIEIQLEAVAPPPPVPVWGPQTTQPPAPPPPAGPPPG